MHHSNETTLSDALAQSIKNGAADVRSAFVEELTNSKEILSILSAYDYLGESKGQVHHFTIVPDSIVLSEHGEGSFKVQYTMEFFYACDALTTKHPQEMVLTFKIDFITRRTVFSGIDLPERGPDEL